MSIARITAARRGLTVYRNAAALPVLSTATPIFTITGGIIRILQLLGVVTTVVQTQACNLKIQQKATGITTIDMCADANISALALTKVVGITGVAADALVMGGGIVAMTTPRIVLPGTIDIFLSATNTGALRWILNYEPLEGGAVVAPAA